MDIEEIIKGRRSIRNYSEKAVSHDDLAKVLNAGKYAPSSGNIQNWVFLVIRDEEKKRVIAGACLNQAWMVQASVHIIICNDLVAAHRFYGDRGEKLYGIQNCAAAAQNMILMAESLGLSTCWVGSFDAEAIKRICVIPDTADPEIIITLGYKVYNPNPPGRHDLIHIAFFETWGNKVLPAKLLAEKVESAGKEAVKRLDKTLKKENIVEKLKKVIKRK